MKYEITKEQINDLYEASGGINESKLKKWFPEAFEVKLEVGKLYKNDADCLFYCQELSYDNKPLGYGFSKIKKWLKYDKETWNTDGLVLATDSEVEAALINEAKKRGFKEGAYYEPISEIGELEIKYHKVGDHFTFYTNENGGVDMSNGYQYIFNNGKWAEIIPTMTQQEAEEKFNVKIV